tara:strand:- start:148 stop:402 length:255 start_codon:yes stop_codon:yes gene_type:complete
MATDYTGIKVTANTADFNAIKIADGVHDIFATSSAAIMSNPVGGAEVALTNVTVDAENNVLSGYDASGTRYIIDKAANITVAIA